MKRDGVTLDLREGGAGALLVIGGQFRKKRAVPAGLFRFALLCFAFLIGDFTAHKKRREGGKMNIRICRAQGFFWMEWSGRLAAR